MNFKNNIDIKRIIICLLGIMVLAYAIGTVIFFVFGKFSSAKYSKAKTIGISRLFEHKYNYSSNKNMNLNGVDEISIDFCFGNIKFNNNTTNDIKVNVDGKIIMSETHKLPELNCYKEGRTLYVELKGKGISLTRDSDIEASISIPNSYKSSIKIVDLAGDIDMSGREFKSINCKLDAVTGAGDIKSDFSDVNISGETKKTASGEVGKSSNTIKLRDKMGDIKINNY